MAVFVPQTCFKALVQSDTVKHVSLADLLRVVLQKIDSKEALEGEYTRHFWNPIISNRSEMKHWHLPQCSAVQCSSTNQLLMHHPVNDAGRLMYYIQDAEPDVWIGWIRLCLN